MADFVVVFSLVDSSLMAWSIRSLKIGGCQINFKKKTSGRHIISGLLCSMNEKYHSYAIIPSATLELCLEGSHQKTFV